VEALHKLQLCDHPVTRSEVNPKTPTCKALPRVCSWLTIPALPVLIISASLLFFALGCSNDDDDMLVFSAASLRDALTPLTETFNSEHNKNVRISFGGSITLSQQLIRGAPGDLFIAAGKAPMVSLNEKGLLDPNHQSTFLTNELVLVVADHKLDAREPLAEALMNSTRIALADPRLAPAGQYARESLVNLGLWDELRSKIVFGGDVRNTLAYVETGSSDAGIVYRSDALTSDRVRIAQVIPQALYSPITYPAAVIKSSGNRETAVEFLVFLQQQVDAGQFQQFGFGIPKHP